MSSLFRVRRSNAGGSGGKMLRGRRAPPLAFSYLRPAVNHEASSPSPRDQSGSVTWISGIVAGAGKLLSSVFRSDSPSSSCSYSYSTDGESSINSDEDEDMSSKEPDEPNQIKRKLEPVKDCNETSLAIISEIDSKHAIEQLIMQETFSRDEGDKLIEIIESRVVEVGKDGIHKGLDKTTWNAVASPGTWKPLNLSRKLPETILSSSGNLNALSPGSSAFQLLIPELRNSAVMEAKKWLEDKRLASSSKVDFDCRARSLNTNMHQYDFDGDEGSPIDVAKSYMRSLSPLKSPSLSSVRFRKTPCREMHLYKDEAPSTPSYSLPSSKGLKRSNPAFESQDTFDEIRKVRLKSSGDKSDNSKFKPIDLSNIYSKHEACKISSITDELIHHNSSKLQASESLDASKDRSAGFCARDYHSVRAHGLPGEKTEGNYSVRMDNTSSPTLISDTEEAINAVQATHQTSSLVTSPSRLYSSLGINPHFCDPAIPISDGNQQVEAPSQVKEQLDGLSGPCITLLIPAPMTVEHADHSDDLLNSEAQTLPPIDINSTPSDVEAGTGEDVNPSSIKLSFGVENNSLHQKLISGVNDVHPVADSKHKDRGEAIQQDGNGQIQDEPNGLRISADGSSAGVNTNIDVATREETNATNLSSGDLVTVISDRACELPSPDEDVLLPKITNRIRGRSRSRGNVKMKTVKDVLTEPQPSISRGRGRKSVPGARRGRGKQTAPVAGR